MNRSLIAVVFIILIAFMIEGCATTKPPPPGTPKPYKVMGKVYKPLKDAKGYKKTGLASWYGKQFHGKKTANGEIYDMYAMSAAHKTLPLGTFVNVRNLENGKEIDVRINDRGPFVRGRIIDLSYKAATELGMAGAGTARVEVTALGAAPVKYSTPDKTDEPAYVPIDFNTGDFTIQVGAFINRENADRLKEKLSETYKNVHISVYDNGVEIFYRVRVGICHTLEKAEEYEKALIQEGFEGAFAVAE